ncbi:hypothetical protein RQP46_001142 [Phenoliferia psychrophenolica]
MDHAVILQAQERLQELFPHADPAYLTQSIEFHLALAPDANATALDARKGKGKGKAKAAELAPDSRTENLVQRIVAGVSHKMLDHNHGEYPTVEWRDVPVRKGVSSERSTVMGSVSANPLVHAVWTEARERGRSRARSEAVATRKEVDHTLGKNKALCRLHTLFPSTPIHELRDALHNLSHSYLFSATETLLAQSQSPPNPSRNFWFPQPRLLRAPSPTRHAAPVPRLAPTELFRSPEYIEALTNHLHALYPLVSRSTIRSLAVDGHPYGEVRDAVASWRAKQNRLKVWIADRFVPRAESSTTPIERQEGPGWDELVAEIWAHERPARLAQAAADEVVAREINQDNTPEEQLFSCGCCFADVPFEDIGSCASGEHVFCRTCIGRQVEEHVFGGAPLGLYQGAGRAVRALAGPGEGTGVRCLSTEGCASPFSHRELERVLSPRVFAALSKRLGEAAIERIASTSGSGTSMNTSSEVVVRCPLCQSYSELSDGAVLSRALPLFSQPTESLSLTSLPRVVFCTMIGLATLIALHLLVMVTISFAPNSFTALSSLSNLTPTSTSSTSKRTDDALPAPTLFPLLEPHRVALLAHEFLSSLARKVLLARTGGRPIFQCRNGPGGRPLAPFADAATEAKDHLDLVERVWGDEGGGEACGRKSCLTCQRVYVDGFHRCFEDDKEGLRLAVEKAMSDAVKRNCPACGVAFQKESGCNKIVCRCGFTQCFLCRKDIGTEGYAHYCGHFRTVVGMPCSTCTRCSLWHTGDDNEAIQKAANQARQAWLRDHPATNGSAVLQQTIGPATVAERGASSM